MNQGKVDIKAVADAALSCIDGLLSEWLPGGRREGHEYVALNPVRADKSAGSFKINLNTGAWSDFACGDAGGDLVSLYRYINEIDRMVEAAQRLGVLLSVPLTSDYTAASVPPVIAPVADWLNIAPAGADAPSMHKAHSHRGFPARIAEYKDADGLLLGAVYRFKKSDGGKEDIPHTLWKNTKTGQVEWRWRTWPEPRPLYGLDQLAMSEHKTILLVEGEKCKDAAVAAGLDDYVVMTWSGGCKAVDKADWAPLKDRTVVIWPDADSQRERLSKADKEAGVLPESKPYLAKDQQPGMIAAFRIAATLTELGCDISLVDVPAPGEAADGWDIADDITRGAELHHLVNAIETAQKYAPVSPAPSVGKDLKKSMGGRGGKADPHDIEEVDSNYSMNSKELFKYFALVEGKARALDKRSGVESTKSALIARFCGKSVDDWMSNPGKLLATQNEVNALKKIKEQRLKAKDEDVLGALERYVYLDGSSNLWDKHLHRIIDQGSAKLALGSKFKDWMDSPMRRVVPFDNVVFEPAKPVPDDCINIFRGLPLQVSFAKSKEDLPRSYIDVIKLYPGCHKILELIWHLCNGDSQAGEWLLNWLAYPLQHIGTKMATAIVLNSNVHGSGKSMLFEEVIKPIYGEYASTVGQSDLESQYTGTRSGKLFMLFEEIFSNKQKYDNSGSLKHLITGKTQRIERKFIDSYEESNYLNCVFLSNHIQPFLIEEHDRRFFVMWPESTMPPELQIAVMDEVGSGGVQEFYNLLMSLPLTLSERLESPVKFDAHTKPIMNDSKRRVIEWGLAGWQLFYFQWERGDIDDTIPYCSCTTDDLWSLYQWWCKRNNEKEMKRNQFVISIGTKVPKARRWWRLKNGNDKNATQSIIFKVGKENGEPEQDYLGAAVIRFKNAVRDLFDGREAR